MARGDYDKYTQAGDNVKLFVFGEKGRANLSRDIPEAMVASIDSCFDKDPLFELVSRFFGFEIYRCDIRPSGIWPHRAHR